MYLGDDGLLHQSSTSSQKWKVTLVEALVPAESKPERATNGYAPPLPIGAPRVSLNAKRKSTPGPDGNGTLIREGNGRVWTSLQSALAFIMVDEQFAEEVASSSGPLWLDFDFRLQQRVPSPLPLKSGRRSPSEAWIILRGYIADQRVEARGVPVERSAFGAVDNPGEPSLLPPEAADQLVLWDEPNGEIWLAPQGQAHLGGCGRFWKMVTVNWLELHQAESADHRANTALHCNRQRVGNAVRVGARRRERKTGPRTKKKQSAIQAMLKEDATALSKMSKKELAHKYQHIAGETTVYEAREAALEILQNPDELRQISPKDK
jgi:hypothetical protein